MCGVFSRAFNVIYPPCVFLPNVLSFRWGGSGGPGMGSRSSSSMGGMAMGDMIRSNAHHMSQPGMGGMGMGMGMQNDRFPMSDFRKY